MFGCTGCHGHDYGELSSEGAPKATARGLRLHHANAGVTVCASCHTDGVPYPENSPAPPYYSRADVNVKNPCNADGTEDLTGDGRGLDNDGDMLYDANDPDCSAAPCAVLPGVMTGLLAAKDTIRDDIRFHWTLDQVAGMYRVYSVGLAADFPPRGDNTAATERCSTPDGLTDNCAHTGIVPSAPNLLFYQVVGVCASNPSVEGPN